MKPFLPRPGRALCSLGISVFLAACGGGGGGGSSGGSGGGSGGSGSDCCYAYSGILPPAQTGTDPLLAQQWHLKNIGQSGGTPGEDLRAVDAWALGFKGDGVRVAVVDDSIETVHEDLWQNFASSLAAGAFFNYRPGAAPGTQPLPYYLDEDHGTSVAGIITARDDNAAGGAGVAPHAQLAAYNPLAHGANSNADIADALRRDGTATAIYNNSWGSPDNGVLNPAEQSFIDAIEGGIAGGRGGKGSIYVFPAGNGGCYLRNPDHTCAYNENSNLDGYVNKRGVIAVCAVDENGRAPVYAEPGANILVCGPSSNERSGITTTTTRNGYRSDFSGTSAATPMVSGVVALMLQANPNLTWRDVRLILARSARRNDAGDSGWSTNFGLHFNPKYGFGTADAAAAANLARIWTSVGGTTALQKCGPYVRGSGAGPFPIDIPQSSVPNASGAIDSVDASACTLTSIEFVEVRFTATHSYSGDLRIELVSPNGLRSLLADKRLCNLDGDAFADDCGSYSQWPFGSVRHMDEPAAGTWQLRVVDASPDSDQGRWNSWQLTLWGR